MSEDDFSRGYNTGQRDAQEAQDEWKAAVALGLQGRGEPVGWMRPDSADLLRRGVRLVDARMSPRRDDEDGLTCPIFAQPPPADSAKEMPSGAACKGSVRLGSGCRRCARCFAEIDSMMRAMNAEPVKVPSDDDLFTIHDEHFPTMMLGHENYLNFARALLARYGQPARHAEDAVVARASGFIAGFICAGGDADEAKRQAPQLQSCIDSASQQEAKP